MAQEYKRQFRLILLTDEFLPADRRGGSGYAIVLLLADAEEEFDNAGVAMAWPTFEAVKRFAYELLAGCIDLELQRKRCLDRETLGAVIEAEIIAMLGSEGGEGGVSGDNGAA